MTVICLIALVLTTLAFYFLGDRATDAASATDAVEEAEALQGDVKDWEGVTSQFNISSSLVMKTMGKTSSKVKMMVGPGEKSFSGHTFPVLMIFDKQGSSGANTAPDGPIFVAVNWHHDGYVTGIDWKGLSPDHPLRNEVEDIWWLISSKTGGNATLELKNPESGRSRGIYKFNRLDELKITRMNLDTTVRKGLNSNESWELMARSTSVPHGVISVVAKQTSSINTSAMNRPLSENIEILFNLTRVKLQSRDISFVGLDNSKANRLLVEFKQKIDDQTSGFIKDNGGIVKTFNKIAADPKYGSTGGLGNYLLKKYTDTELVAALSDHEMDEKARAEMVLAIQLQEGNRAEKLLLTIASSSSLNANNAYRAVIALGQRNETSIEVIKTLADLSVYKRDPDGSVANNALIQLAWLRRYGGEDNTRVIDKALSDYQKTPDMKPDLLLYAQQATGQSTYRDSAIETLNEKAGGTGAYVPPEVRIAAAKLIATQASIGDQKAIDYVKQYITKSGLKDESVQVLSHFADAYISSPADSRVEDRMKDMLNQGEGAQAKHLYYKMLSGSPDRCRANEGFIRQRMANGDGTDIFRTACEF